MVFTWPKQSVARNFIGEVIVAFAQCEKSLRLLELDPQLCGVLPNRLHCVENPILLGRVALAFFLIAREQKLDPCDAAFERGKVKGYVLAEMAPFIQPFLFIRLCRCRIVVCSFGRGSRECRLRDDERAWAEEAFRYALKRFLLDV